MFSKGNPARRALQGMAAVLALCLLSACGGGEEPITPFEPTRMLVLGDEMSVMTAATDPPIGRKYSVNQVQAADTTQIDCNAFPLWHQVVANNYRFAYRECNPDGLTTTAAKIYAQPGAKISSLAAQFVAATAANGSFSNTDLFLLLVGANDVLDLYENVYRPNPSTETYNAAIAELQERGRRLGQFVNEVTRLEVTGPKVIVSTIPRMNLTPYATAQAAANPGIQVYDTLRAFSDALNTAMRVTIVNDGRFIGLVELDAILQAGYNDPASYGLVNSLQAVCVVDLPGCDNVAADLRAGGNAQTWLWASDLWMGPTAHQNLGNFAWARANGNPF